ncbi:MAG TPA: exopolysaccharide biosynthesis polyprenyl glycosylphosphotransferase [bacterium]|nr:exopolysaccharide biosynthesis polyprenyl glycosylphosphotransferase [bacterium]
MTRPWVSALFDAALVNVCIVAVFAARFLGDVPERNIVAYRQTWFYITAIFVAVFYLQGLYDNDESDDAISIFFKAMSGVALATVCVMALTFLSRAFAFPRTVIMMSAFVQLVAVSVVHIRTHRAHLRTLPARKTVVFGGDAKREHIEGCVVGSRWGRFVLWEGEAARSEGDVRAALGAGADCAIVSDDAPRARDFAFELALSFPRAVIYLVPDVADIAAGARHHIVIGDVPLTSPSRPSVSGRFSLIKRAMDAVVAGVALVALAPVMAVAAAAVIATSRGPVFYSQERVGRGGRMFRILKFRTMAVGAEEETGPALCGEDDPRVTRAGRVLRNLKIDELPQLINVLKGEMSVVGPRPERPEFVAEFEAGLPAYANRKLALPGMTGLAQVYGRYETDAAMKLKYDLIYIYNYSPGLDVKIMYRTAQHILRENAGRGRRASR